MNGTNVKNIDEEKECSLMGLLVVSLIYYPECPSSHLAVGSDRHSDVSSITLLLEDDIGGLYARPEGDQWVHVAPIKSELIVNIGYALQIMSNDRYKSIEHRVFLTGSTNRVSVPIFANAFRDDNHRSSSGSVGSRRAANIQERFLRRLF
ncbi:feruloyl coa ortho-hydroxylase 2 [Phtheirospermum japonicum]|uniref:Feruloyl coa ortho-hydroxylase 2 n=1 Tax=Phtheirospermum japonicum TaxID=374723 RepID=A0A830D125_9LAMI|nr:feruloyl coa ortho-hydroxylase 2 [Phtheirospermum japonicum]